MAMRLVRSIEFVGAAMRDVDGAVSVAHQNPAAGDRVQSINSAQDGRLAGGTASVYLAPIGRFAPTSTTNLSSI